MVSRQTRQFTEGTDLVGQTLCFVTATRSDTIPLPAPAPCPAKQLLPRQRQELAIAVLADTAPVSDLARQHQAAERSSPNEPTPPKQALGSAFDSQRPADEVLFHLPVTKAWLRQ